MTERKSPFHVGELQAQARAGVAPPAGIAGGGGNGGGAAPPGEVGVPTRVPVGGGVVRGCANATPA